MHTECFPIQLIYLKKFKHTAFVLICSYIESIAFISG